LKKRLLPAEHGNEDEIMRDNLLKVVLSCVAACVLIGIDQAQAQQVQPGGGGATVGGGSAGGGTTNTGAGGTVGGELSGLTTQLATDGASQGGFAGANAASSFVGGAGTDGGFVGGARESTAGGAANRQFRGITDTGVVGAGTGQQTGTPRRIPVAFRVSFTAPVVSQLQRGTLAVGNAVNVQRFTPLRPQLAGINVNLSSAGVATLSGSAPDAATRRLAANLMRLQPGVRSIRNDVELAIR
jgi:BON domain